MTAQRVLKTTVTLLFFGWLVDYIDRLVIAIALPSIGKTFHLNPVEVGLIMSAFFLTYALLQIPGGLLGDRFGSKKVMTWALAAWSVFTALTGAASSYIGLLIVRTLFGVSEGMFPGSSMKAIGERTPKSSRLASNGLMLASNPLGAALAPLIAAPAIALVGWRDAFYWVAGLGIIMALLIWFVLPKPLDSNLRLETPASNPEGGVGKNSLALLKVSTMWKFALMFFGFDIVGWGLISWGPSYLIDVRHVHIVATGFLVSIPWFAATISTVLGGFLFDRYFSAHHRWLIVPAELIAAIFLMLLTSSTTVSQFVLYSTGGIFFMFLAFMPIFGLPLRLLSPKVMASGGAMVNFGGQTGGFLAPVIMGWLISTFSYGAAFGFLVFGVLLSAGAALWIPESPDAFEKAIRRADDDAPLSRGLVG